MEGKDEFARQALVCNSSEHQAFSLKRPGIGIETALRAEVLPTITVFHNHAIGFDRVGSFTDIAHAIWVIVRCNSIISITPKTSFQPRGCTSKVIRGLFQEMLTYWPPSLVDGALDAWAKIVNANFIMVEFASLSGFATNGTERIEFLRQLANPDNCVIFAMIKFAFTH